MNMTRSTRMALPQNDFRNRDQSDFDTELNKAIELLKRGLPHEWGVILGYLRSMALPMEMNPEMTESVTAEYHKKAYVVKIVKRLNGLDAA